MYGHEEEANIALLEEEEEEEEGEEKKEEEEEEEEEKKKKKENTFTVIHCKSVIRPRVTCNCSLPCHQHYKSILVKLVNYIKIAAS